MSADWRQVDTADAYKTFCEDHGRYADSSRWLVDALVREVGADGARYLDWAAGTGVTSIALAHALARQKNTSVTPEITAFEPSPAMSRHHPATRALRCEGVRWRLCQQLPPAMGLGFQGIAGNSMWWLLQDPVAELSRMTPWMAPDAVVAWSTPALYCGTPPSAAETAFSIAFNEVRVAAGAPVVSVDSTDDWTGPLDPVAVFQTAGWEICHDGPQRRTCTASEWLAHTLLPPVRPPWLRALEPAAATQVVRAAKTAMADLPAAPQEWRITVARRRAG